MFEYIDESFSRNRIAECANAYGSQKKRIEEEEEEEGEYGHDDGSDGKGIKKSNSVRIFVCLVSIQ